MKLTEGQRTLIVALLDDIREPNAAQIDAAIAPYRYKNTAEFDAVYRTTVAQYWRAMIDVLRDQVKEAGQ